MKKLLSVLILSAVFIRVVPMQASALPIMNSTLTACDSIVVTNTNSYLETFDSNAECWNLNSGIWEWYLGSSGYLYQPYGFYTCHAVSPILDISALTNPYLSFSQKRPDYNNSEVGDHLSVYYRNMSQGADSSWVLLRTYTDYLNAWTLDSLPLPSGVARIQLKFTAVGMGDDADGCYLDNVCVYNASGMYCYPVSQLEALSVTESSVNLSWFGISELGYLVRYKRDTDPEWTYTDTTHNMSIQIHNLLPFCNYVAEVSAICDSMLYSTIAFTTLMHAVNLPYSSDFSHVSNGEWQLDNGSCHNYWKIGNPANLSTSGALFVTSDGVNAHYDSTFYSVISARKIFNTGNSESISISFDVQIGGESYFDYLKVFLAPLDVEYSASTSPVNYAHHNYSVNALDFSDYLSQTGTSNYPYKLNITNGNVLHIEENVVNPVPGGLVQLVFLWKNDGDFGTQPGAVVSNVYVGEMLCLSPANLTAVNVSSQSATIVWDPFQSADGYILQYKPASLSWDDSGVISVGLENAQFNITGSLLPNTDYDVRVATDCGTDTSFWATTSFTTVCGMISVTDEMPFEETFSSAPLCWDLNAGVNAWTFEPNGYLHHLYGTYNCSAISPILNVSGVSVPMVRFSQKRPDYDGSTIADQMSVYYRSVHVTTDTAWHLLKTYTEYMNVWTDDSLMLPNGLTTIQLRFTVNGMGDYADGCYLDNVKVYNGDPTLCPPVVQLAVSNVTATSALITWNGFSENGYEFRYKAEGETNWTWDTTHVTEVWITGLVPGYHYTVEVSSICENMDFSSVDFSTDLNSEVLPYYTDFTDVAPGDWRLSNGSCTNRWVIGTTNLNPAQSALFISSDGNNAHYDTTAFSIVTATKLFAATQAESFLLSFDVQSGGESHFDYLKVFLAPADMQYPASTTATTYGVCEYSEYAVNFSDYLHLTGNQGYEYKLNLTNDSVLHVSVEMPNPSPNGQIQLVFLWHNDVSLGKQPGAVIYNVSLQDQTCYKPTNLAASSVGVNSATLTWNAGDENGQYILQYTPAGHSWDASGVTSVAVTGTTYVISSGLMQNTEYIVRVATDCGTDTSSWCTATFSTECGTIIVTNDTPFEEDFSTYPVCWDLTSGESPWKYSEQSEFLYHNYGYYTSDAITPVLDITGVSHPYLSCNHRHQDHNGSGVTDSVKIYYRTSPTAPWVLIHSCAGPMVTWDSDTMALPNPTSTYQIKFRAVGMGEAANGCALNDIFIFNMVEPTATTIAPQGITNNSVTLKGIVSNPDHVSILSKGFEWKTTAGGTYTQVNATGDTMSYWLTGLTSSTNYTFRAFVTTAFGTSYGEAMTFTTLDPCAAPTGLELVSLNADGLTITWDNADVAGWNIQYRQENGIYNSATSATNSFVIHNIQENTTYIIRVQAVCQVHDFSEWSDSIVVIPNGLPEYLANSVLVFPNPTQDYVNIKITNEEIQVKGLEVYDVYGKLITVVETNHYSPLQTRINVSALADGMYFIRMTTDQGILTKPFVKR